MPTYINIDGIKGNVTSSDHKDWIEVLDMSFGLGRSIAKVDPGKMSNREASTANFSEISFSKWMDETTPHLFIESCVGKSKPIKISVCRTGETIKPYMEYTLNNALLSHYSVKADDHGEHPLENYSINFDKIEMKYTPYNDKHEPGSPIPAGYDLVEAKKV